MTDLELFLKYNRKIPLISYSSKINFLLNGTYQCNNNCSYCYNQNIRNIYKNAIIDKKTITNFLSIFKPIINNICWHGGETTLLDEDLIFFLEQEKQRLNIQCETNIQTNGILMTPEKIQRLNNKNIQIGYSFDGIFNNETRGVKITQSILSLIKDNQNIGFITVYNQEHIQQILENYYYYKQLGVSSVVSNFVHERTISQSYEQETAQINTADFVSCVFDYIKYWVYDIYGPIYDRTICSYIESFFKIPDVCTFRNCIGSHLLIDPYGNVGICGTNLLEDSIGNVNEVSNYQDILSSPKYLQILNAQEQLVQKHCLKCLWKDTCYGGCMEINHELDPAYNTISAASCNSMKKLMPKIFDLIKEIDITREDIYNPIFLDILKQNNYISLSEIKKREG